MKNTIFNILEISAIVLGWTNISLQAIAIKMANSLLYRTFSGKIVTSSLINAKPGVIF